MWLAAVKVWLAVEKFAQQVCSKDGAMSAALHLTASKTEFACLPDVQY